MIFNTMRVGRSPFFERKAKAPKATPQRDAETLLCLQCCEEHCSGNCGKLKAFRKGNEKQNGSDAARREIIK